MVARTQGDLEDKGSSPGGVSGMTFIRVGMVSFRLATGIDAHI